MNPSQEKSTTYGCKISGSPFVKIVMDNKLLLALMITFGVTTFAGFVTGTGEMIFVGFIFFISLGLVYGVNYVRLKAKLPRGGGEAGGKEGDASNDRLSEIERRLTDTQDVMIALSEKFDRWEEERTRV